MARRGLLLLLTWLLAGAASAGPAEKFYESAIRKAAANDYAAAIIELKNALQANPDYLAAWATLGDYYLKQGHAPSAEVAYQKAAKLGADPHRVFLPLARCYLLQMKLDELRALEAPVGFSAAEKAELLLVKGQAELEANQLVQAVDAFDRVLELDAGKADALYGKTLALLRWGRLDDASKAAAACIERFPGDSGAWYVHGEVARSQGAFDAALADFTKAIELSPGHLAARLGRAALAIDLQHYADARHDLDALRANDPDDLQGIYLRALLQAQEGDLQAADVTLDRARAVLGKLPPQVTETNPSALMVGSLIALKQNEPNKAIEYLEAYLKRAAKHRGALKLLVSAYLQTGELEKAKGVLEDLAAAYPKDPTIATFLGSVYGRLGMHAEAEAAYRRAVGLGLDTAEVRRELGLSLLAEGQTGEALEAFSAALGPGETNSNTGLMMAYTLLRQGSPEQALMVVEKLIEHGPAYPAYHNFAGAMAMMLNRLPEASAHFEAALKLDPKYTPAKINLAEIARQQKDWAKAQAIYDALYELVPKNAGVLRGQANLALDQRRLPEAIGWYEQLRAAFPDEIPDRLALVRLYLATGKLEAARRDAKLLRARHPDDLNVVLGALDVALAGHDAADSATLLRRATALAGEDATKLRLLAASQERAGETKAAIATLERVQTALPRNAAVAVELGAMRLRAGEAAAALSQARRALGIAPKDYGALMLAGRANLVAKQYEAAIEAFTRARPLTTGYSPVTALAEARAEHGEVKGATTELEALRAEHPEAAELGLALARLYLRTNRTRDAVRVYEEILARDGQVLEAGNNLAWLYNEQKDPRAVALVENLLVKFPGDAAVLDTAGCVLLAHGREADALRYLREAALRDSADLRIRLHLATALAKSGNAAEARETLAPVLADRAFPEHAAAEKLLTEIEKR
ncbi:MAG: PEP-CTERM system TPR-repeat protein PrsT [Gammaproteobacteria bacterium]|nr:PEP-CTERM system TPR-repeat protein PrsT [Gammaproteobacteria bacterium]